MPILECHALEKRYGSAMALDHIDLALFTELFLGAILYFLTYFMLRKHRNLQ